MKRILDFFGSLRLTLGILLGLSVVSVAGTILPAAPGRYDLFYQAPWFRFLLGLLALNLAVCTWRTLARTWSARLRLCQALASLQPATASAQPPLAASLEAQALQQRLAASGYRVTLEGDRLLAERHAPARWAVPILHLCILAIMCGGLAAELGFVGTLNLYVGHETDKYFDWEVEAEQPLAFTFRLDHFEPRYYPIDLRFALIDPVSRETLQVYTTREGETVDLGDGLSVLVERFFPEEEHLVLQVLRDGIPIGAYHALSGKRNYPNPISLPAEIRPVAFKDPLLKQLHSEVSILEDGRVVKQGIIEVNQPLVYRGIAIYQTAYNRDKSGFWSGGYQLSKDPGEWLVWSGSILLCLALVVVFVVRPRAVGLVPSAAGWHVVGLAGFRGDAGRVQLDQLKAVLDESR